MEVEAMSKQTVCEVLLDVLAEAGARQIFGMTGDALNPFLEAMRGDERFEWIGVRHEETAAYAACSQSILTGGIGVCAGTVGPGALHLINGLYNAKREYAGVVAITGQVAHREMGTNYHQEVDLKKMFDDVCGYQAIINSAEQMPRLAQIAVQKALVDRQVVRIELPIDVSTERVSSSRMRHRLLRRPSRLIPPDAELRRAADLINAGGNVALLCGVGCRDAKAVVLQLAQTLCAPIVHTLKGKEIFDCDDANVVGMTGLIGNPAGYHAVRDADVLIMLGTDFPYEWFLPEQAVVIQIDTSVERIGRRAAVEVSLLGTVADTVPALLPMLQARTDDKFLRLQAQRRDGWQTLMDEQASLTRDSQPLHPQLFARAISDRADADAVFAVDVGECTVWLARQMRLGGDRRLIGSFNHSSLGAGLGSAIGAIGLNPARQVWALCGDGGFGMSLQDFVTAVRYHWPLKIIVFNNGELGFVKMEMEVAGYAVNDAATALVNPDFAAFARACGAQGVRVTEAVQIIPAIERALDCQEPFVIDAIVSPGELVMPPHVDVKQAWGFGLSKVREGVLGLRGDRSQWPNWRDEIRARLR
jgi:thiamine pyrophosphate-dependent acetolactate synthase large subunit-like protein